MSLHAVWYSPRNTAGHTTGAQRLTVKCLKIPASPLFMRAEARILLLWSLLSSLATPSSHHLTSASHRVLSVTDRHARTFVLNY